jgi:hypothetical protein
MAYDLPHRALARSARRTYGTARPAATPTHDLWPTAGWAALLDTDRRGAADDGNPCQGIVVGCLLSLPIWLVLVFLVRLLIG